MEPEIHTNPFTGEKFTREAVEWGIATSPAQHCFGSKGLNQSAGTTRHFALNLKPDEMRVVLTSVATGLSQMTGKDIEFISNTDNCCSVWQDFGFFVVKDPIKFTEVTEVGSSPSLEN